MYIKEKYSVKKQIAILNCHQPLNTWQIACKLDLIYLMFYKFTKDFLKSHLQVFKSSACIFAIISMLMTGLIFTFVLLNKMWEYKKKKANSHIFKLGVWYSPRNIRVSFWFKQEKDVGSFKLLSTATFMSDNENIYWIL